MRNIQNFSMVFLTAVFLVVCPKMSYAYSKSHQKESNHNRSYHNQPHHSYRYHDHPRWGMSISWLPDSFINVRLGGSRYYYYDGLYYNRFGREYVIVAPPVGAVVHSIPTDFRPVVINGVTYYEDRGTYYVYTRAGYQVVSQPVELIQPRVVTAQAEATIATQVNALPVGLEPEESFTVNIPNNQGGYTAVLLRRSAKGFVGPQGEFYSDFPKIAQLKVMYAK